jgi:hypothetical protein
MKKSAAFMLGFQQGLDSDLNMEKIAELVEIFEGYEKASEHEKKAMWGRFASLLKRLMGKGKQMPKKPPPPRKRMEGIRSPMAGGGSTKSY